jgi:hypothetical protein
MHRIGWMLSLALAAVGCQKSSEPFEGQGLDQPPGYGQDSYGQPGQQGTTGQEPGTDGQQGQYGQPGTNGQEGQYDQAAIVSPEIKALEQNVQLIRGASELAAASLVQSLRDLSKAFQVLPNAGSEVTDATARINGFADRIEASGETTDMHARWTKRALTEAVGALEGYQKAQNASWMGDRLTTIGAQVDQIADDQPLVGQKDMFANVYEQLANTIQMAATPPQQPAGGTQ